MSEESKSWYRMTRPLFNSGFEDDEFWAYGQDGFQEVLDSFIGSDVLIYDKAIGTEPQQVRAIVQQKTSDVYNSTTVRQILCNIGKETGISEVIRTHDIDAVFLEDIQLRKNVQSFKKLAQLQGVLVNMCEKTNILYNLVAPTQWQNYCKARGRTTKEIKSKITSVEPTGKKTSKILSLQAARDIYGIVTENDNLADAVMIGHYVVNNIKIGSEDDFNEKERDD